jgi:hypothetical protein
MPASVNGPNYVGVEDGRVLNRFVKWPILGDEGGAFILRHGPHIQLCWLPKEWLPPLDTMSSWRPIASLADCEVDLTQN